MSLEGEKYYARLYIIRGRERLSGFNERWCRDLSIRDEIERVRGLLAQGRNAEAVEVAAMFVRALGRDAEPSLLAEALLTQGAALARTGEYSRAREAMERAVEIAERAVDAETAGRSALAFIEELHAHAGEAELLELYYRADELLSGSQDRETLKRLRDCARHVFDARLRHETAHSADTAQAVALQMAQQPESAHEWEGCSLEEEVLNYEKNLIRLALDAAGGKVTQAARHLGMTHQLLAFILNTRHKDLLEARKPVRPRRRSILRSRRADNSEKR